MVSPLLILSVPPTSGRRTQARMLTCHLGWKIYSSGNAICQSIGGANAMGSAADAKIHPPELGSPLPATT